jgi:hypothetical protein
MFGLSWKEKAIVELCRTAKTTTEIKLALRKKYAILDIAKELHNLEDKHLIFYSDKKWLTNY